ncbi:TetR/AcrR family transcriptional regulator [uncultured Lacinutrix sp.]|uniref:TetR/AcrR family transcriptional regulator n=1 Tax=uncultured Lacinutrix sp. TaxID=574032 RepID=UPI00261CD27F|nr:TetR/AcrR family transcriptional regulator [uncultured Lacinutrix sp.]
MKIETRKQQIINAAATLFKEKGYSAVTMRDIAKSMGIKASSLYNHISSKQDILTTIIISLAEEFTNGMDVIKTSQIDSIEKLKQIISLHISITTSNTFGMSSLNSDWMHLEERLDYYLKLRDDYEENFRCIIINGIKNKEIIDVNPEVMLFSILSTLRSLYLWIPKKEDLKQEELVENLSQVLISGVQK